MMKSSKALARSGRSRRMRSKLARVKVDGMAGLSNHTVAERTEYEINPDRAAFTKAISRIDCFGDAGHGFLHSE
jgi:hypothetical protein